MKNRIKINILIGIVAILFVFILVISNIFVASVKMIVVPGSYAETYAKKHHLSTTKISDSEMTKYDQRYELFDYNTGVGGSLHLSGYQGCSETLVIPAIINGDIVSNIDSSFFENLDPSVKKIYIPNTLDYVKGTPSKEIAIYCKYPSIFVDMRDTSGNFKELQDSDEINFGLRDLEFEYNTLPDGIDITKYTGKDSAIIIIPSHINGIPVTSISMDLLGAGPTFYIPETVTSITGETTKAIFGMTFAVQLIFTIIAFVLALVSVNIVIPIFNKNNKEYLLSSPQIIVTVLYLLFQSLICILVVYFIRIPLLVSIVISCVLLVIYIAISFIGGTGREHSKGIAEKIEEKTAFMRDLKESTKHLADGIEDEKAKKAVQELVDEIRFSKLSESSIDETIMNQVKELKNSINEKDYQKIKEQSIQIKNLIKKR